VDPCLDIFSSVTIQEPAMRALLQDLRLTNAHDLWAPRSGGSCVLLFLGSEPPLCGV